MLVPFFNDVVGLLGAIGFWPLTVFLPIQMHLKQAGMCSTGKSIYYLRPELVCMPHAYHEHCCFYTVLLSFPHPDAPQGAGMCPTGRSIGCLTCMMGRLIGPARCVHICKQGPNQTIKPFHETTLDAASLSHALLLYLCSVLTCSSLHLDQGTECFSQVLHTMVAYFMHITYVKPKPCITQSAISMSAASNPQPSMQR